MSDWRASGRLGLAVYAAICGWALALWSISRNSELQAELARCLP